MPMGDPKLPVCTRHLYTLFYVKRFTEKRFVPLEQRNSLIIKKSNSQFIMTRVSYMFSI